MMRLSASVLAFVFCLPPATKATDYSWGNVAGGNWNASGNWGGGIPGVNDNATLGVLAGSYTVLVTDTRSVNNFDLLYANAALTVTGNWTVAGTANIDMGTFNLNSNTTTINGSLVTGSAATSNWNGGILAGTGTLYGILNVISGSNNHQIAGTTLKNAGTINWNSGSIGDSGTTSFTNMSTGMIEFKADGAGFTASFHSTLVNQGTLRKSGGTGATGTTMAWAVDFQNGSTIDVLSGTLFFNGGGTLNNGTTTVTGTGTSVLNNGTFTVAGNATFTAAGTGSNFLRWIGGTLTADPAGGTLAGTLIAASGSNDKILSGNSLSNAGTFAWTGGAIRDTGASTVLTNLEGGVIDLRADGTAFNNSNASIINQGTIRKSAGGSTPTVVGWYVNFRDGGTLDATVGTLNFDHGGTLSSGTTTVTGTGIVALNNGTFTFPANATFTAAGTGSNFLRWTGGTLSADPAGGTLAGTLIAASGSNSKTISENNLSNAGTFAWTGGVISAFGNFTNLPGAVLDFRADGTAFTTLSGFSIMAHPGSAYFCH